jgi:hypothetical protein
MQEVTNERRRLTELNEKLDPSNLPESINPRAMRKTVRGQIVALEQDGAMINNDLGRIEKILKGRSEAPSSAPSPTTPPVRRKKPDRGLDRGFPNTTGRSNYKANSNPPIYSRFGRGRSNSSTDVDVL